MSANKYPSIFSRNERLGSALRSQALSPLPPVALGLLKSSPSASGITVLLKTPPKDRQPK